MNDTNYRTLIQKQFDINLSEYEQKQLDLYLKSNEAAARFCDNISDVIDIARDAVLPDHLIPRDPDGLARSIVSTIPEHKRDILGRLAELISSAFAKKCADTNAIARPGTNDARRSGQKHAYEEDRAPAGAPASAANHAPAHHECEGSLHQRFNSRNMQESNAEPQHLTLADAIRRKVQEAHAKQEAELRQLPNRMAPTPSGGPPVPESTAAPTDWAADPARVAPVLDTVHRVGPATAATSGGAVRLTNEVILTIGHGNVLPSQPQIKPILPPLPIPYLCESSRQQQPLHVQPTPQVSQMQSRPEAQPQTRVPQPLPELEPLSPPQPEPLPQPQLQPPSQPQPLKQWQSLTPSAPSNAIPGNHSVPAPQVIPLCELEERINFLFSEPHDTTKQSSGIAGTPIELPQRIARGNLAGIGRIVDKREQPVDDQGKITEVGRFLLDGKAQESITELITSGLTMSKVRVVSLEIARQLEEVLKPIEMSKSVLGSLVLGYDGILILSTLPPDCDIETIGSCALVTYMNTQNILDVMGKKRLNHLISKSPAGYSVIGDFGGGILVTLTDASDVDIMISLIEKIEQATAH